MAADGPPFYWPSDCIYHRMENSSKIHRFEDLLVWQKGMDLAEEIYRTTRKGEFAKDWGLRDQVRKAAVSIPSNIAEGFGRYKSADFKRFLTIANASAYEVRSQVQLAERLGYLDEQEAGMIIGNCMEISRMLMALNKKINKF